MDRVIWQLNYPVARSRHSYYLSISLQLLKWLGAVEHANATGAEMQGFSKNSSTRITLDSTRLNPFQ